MGFSEYLSALRIQHAKEALLDYHRRIYEIAAQVGYQDVKHFMKVFKKQVGMTPAGIPGEPSVLREGIK